MRGSIKFSNGKVVYFNDQNMNKVFDRLTKKQKRQIKRILFKKMRSPNEYNINEEVYECWHEDVFGKNVQFKGGSKNGSTKINKKGSPKLIRKWDEKGDREKNLTWLHVVGFRRKWFKDIGYVYRYLGIEIPSKMLEMEHEEFKRTIEGLIRDGLSKAIPNS